MKEINLIFPIGGKGDRFGDKFKAFIKIGDKTFIEKAVEPFLKWKESFGIFSGHFVFYSEQSDELGFSISSELEKMFKWKFGGYSFIGLGEREESVCKAIIQFLETIDDEYMENVIICDCDHSINVDPIFEYLQNNKIPDCLVPIWDLKDEEIKNWGIGCVGSDNNLIDIAEKKYPKTNGDFFGVIGCVFFKEIKGYYFRESQYISDVIKCYIKDKKEVKVVKIKEAEFFGDPERLKRIMDKKYIGTIFCDLDGTIIKHDNKGFDFELLPGAKEKLQEWKENGYYIVITTGKDEMFSIAQYLKQEKVAFNKIITGLPSGERILINDRKPYDFLKPMARVVEVERDEGIKNVHLEPKPEMKLLTRFWGGGFSETFLVNDGTKTFIRKIAKKDKNLELGYYKLKKQYLELLRFNNMLQGVVPVTYGEYEDSYEYYYDMEYLKHYKPLHELNTIKRQRALVILFDSILPRIYSYTTKGLNTSEGESWLLNHLSEKIYPILNTDNLDKEVVNKIKSDLNKVMESEILHPKFICPISGDLTYENILFNQYSKDLKLIDLNNNNTNTLDPPELDLGKLLQSCDCQYETWSRSSVPEDMTYNFEMEQDNKFIFDYYSKVLDCGEKDVKIKGEFYLALHLIRMIPYRLKVSQIQADFALKIASDYLKLIKERLES